MSFQNNISAKRDPHDARDLAAARGVAPGLPSATIELDGAFDDRAATEILAELERRFTAGMDSIVIDMRDVRIEDFERLRAFVAEVMELRSSSANVQIAVRDPELYEEMHALPFARDWLLSKPDADAEGSRRGIHLDGPLTP